MKALLARFKRPAPPVAVPPMPATCEPRLPRTSWFTGALLPICNVQVLVVVVQPRVMIDTFEANLYVAAFNLRFQRTIVLVAQDEQTHVPTYYGPAGIVRALSSLPFEMIPWQRMLYRTAKPPSWQLPIPPEEPPSDSSVPATASYSSSIEEMSKTILREVDADVAAARIACTTRR